MDRYSKVQWPHVCQFAVPMQHAHNTAPPESVLQWRRSRAVRCLQMDGAAYSKLCDPAICPALVQRDAPAGGPAPRAVSTTTQHTARAADTQRVPPDLHVSATQATAASALYSSPRSSSCRSWPHCRSRAQTEPSAWAGTNQAGVKRRPALNRSSMLRSCAAVAPLSKHAAGALPQSSRLWRRCVAWSFMLHDGATHPSPTSTHPWRRYG